jgi:hypothetical protein
MPAIRELGNGRFAATSSNCRVTVPGRKRAYALRYEVDRVEAVAPGKKVIPLHVA